MFRVSAHRLNCKNGVILSLQSFSRMMEWLWLIFGGGMPHHHRHNDISFYFFLFIIWPTSAPTIGPCSWPCLQSQLWFRSDDFTVFRVIGRADVEHVEIGRIFILTYTWLVMSLFRSCCLKSWYQIINQAYLSGNWPSIIFWTPDVLLERGKLWEFTYETLTR